jgi:ABC-type transport system involved in multi-copper enzyme maturation permease subunit
MAARAAAVAGYTLLELSRRRVLLALVAAAAVLTAVIGIVPLILPGMDSTDERAVFVLGAFSRADGLAITLCAFAIGMTVINHDLNSGAIVAILAKPLTRLSYAAGKLAAALFTLVLVCAIFAAGSVLLIQLDGGGHTDVMFWFFAASAANALLLMVLVTMLTVYLNNVIAAGIVAAFAFLQVQLATLHLMLQNSTVTPQALKAASTVAYWLVPHDLVSNLGRDLTITSFNINCSTGCPGMRPTPAAYLANQLAGIPGASGGADIVYWVAYLAVLCALLYAALRFKQV